MTWLVTGGAGYIGAHVVRLLLGAGEGADGDVVVVDDLSTGDASRVPGSVPFVECSIHDTAQLVQVLSAYGVTGIVHLAGHKAVAESITHPLEYYFQNVDGLHSVLTAMVRTGVRRILFSSSAAVYGPVTSEPVSETSPTEPGSPYGWTKLTAERLLRDTAAAHGLDWAVLRYFNVGGAAVPELGDTGVDNLLPRLLDAVERGIAVGVNGVGHPTHDGSCVRDYVHVADVAAAHHCVLDRLQAGPIGSVYNIGTGRGTSVLEMIDAVRRVTGQPLAWYPAPARPGDAAEVVADATRIGRDLGWSAERDLDELVRSAWRARTLSRVRQ
ncbi:UDP-glucose 4-epimerase GalE [Kribbella sp. WER1]